MFVTGTAGRFNAVVKDLGIPITNTLNMFGGEVAGTAVRYVFAQARQTLDRDRGVRMVNVWRAPIIDRAAPYSGQVSSAALDVFETEPLSMDSSLRSHPRCVLETHNANNTADVVAHTSEIAIGKLMYFLGRDKA